MISIVNSEFPQKMNQWLNEHSLEKSTDLKHIEEFIQNHIWMINKTDAEYYLPQLIQIVKWGDSPELLIKKIKDIQTNLLSNSQKRETRISLEDKIALALSAKNDLSFLDLSETQVTDAHLKQLSQMSNLKHLNLAACLNITDEGVHALIHLESLNVSCCKNLTDGAFELLVNLKFLDASCCDNLTNGAFKSLVNLKFLKVRGCNKLTDAAFKPLIELLSLDICLCTQLTATAFKSLANLRSLIVSWCRQLKDNAFESLPNLQSLTIHGCDQLTIAAFKPLINLKSLYASFCYQLADDALEAMLKQVKIYR